MTTKELELKLFATIAGKNGNPRYIRKGYYICFEVTIPHHKGVVKRYHRERVDAMSLESHGGRVDEDIYRCFELKISKQDFKSSAALSFFGHYNYFVMPRELYEKVSADIPKGIGVYVADEGVRTLELVKRPQKQELIIPADKLQFSLMKAMAREARRYFISTH